MEAACLSPILQSGNFFFVFADCWKLEAPCSPLHRKVSVQGNYEKRFLRGVMPFD
ncbi:hypothetical protein QN277_001807 [Acacia crassicarpa]|uniref:Uncharacterized protein n=1 Tax=Acacia crassicarpa TaxID=499986 RepID=A0AAE1TH73_9FABA|nr:hypothetical protein QN277_001807 [Acacia crassicarpa]